MFMNILIKQKYIHLLLKKHQILMFSFINVYLKLQILPLTFQNFTKEVSTLFVVSTPLWLCGDIRQPVQPEAAESWRVRSWIESSTCPALFRPVPWSHSGRWRQRSLKCELPSLLDLKSHPVLAVQESSFWDRRIQPRCVEERTCRSFSPAAVSITLNPVTLIQMIRDRGVELSC